MKIIFSKEKYIEKMGYEAYQEAVKFGENNNYVDACDGKTIEECNKLGYLIPDDWCVEVEDD